MAFFLNPRRTHNPSPRLRAAPWGCAVISVAGIILPQIWGGAGQCAIAADKPAAAQPDAPVDAAAKSLMAANGLFQRGLFQLAAQAYTDFLGQYPTHPQATAARYALAICEYRLTDFEKASGQLNIVLKDANFAQRDEALAVLGHCELSQKHFDKAIGAFDELLAKYPKSKHAEVAALNRVQALYLAGQQKQCAQAAQQFISTYPKSDQRSAALYFMALSQRAGGDNDKAIQTAAQLEKEFPDSPYRVDASLLTAQTLEAQGKLKDAVEQFRRLLASAPDSRKAEAHYALGVALYKSAAYEESARELSAVLSAGAGDYEAPARLQLGLTDLAAGKTADARQALDQVVKQDPARAADARYALAQCDIADKQFDAARQKLGELLKMQPPPANAAQITLDRAVCLMAEGKLQDAAGEFDAFRKTNPNSPQSGEALYRQAYCLLGLKQFDQSHALLAHAPAGTLGDFAGPAQELDAENLFSMAKYPEAAKAFAALAATSKDPKEQSLLALRIGQCAYFAGDYAKAVDLLAPIASQADASKSDQGHQAMFLAGDALLQLGKNQQASQMLGRYVDAVRLNPKANENADTSEARFKLGLAQLRMGDASSADAALATLAQVAQGPAASPWVQRSLLEVGQIYYKAGKAPQAAEALNKVVAAGAPAELAAPAGYLLGWIDFDARKFADAAAKWQGVVASYPTQPIAVEAAFHRGVALKDAGKLDEAAAVLQAFSKAHADSPDAVRAGELAAECLGKQGKTQESLQLLASIASGPKTSDTALYDLAWAQRGAKDPAAAQETYRRLIKTYPDAKLAIAARTELAELLYDGKQYDQAIDLLQQVLKQQPKSNDSVDAKTMQSAAYRLAWCYDRLGQRDKAAAAFVSFAGGVHSDHEDAGLAASALLEAGVDYSWEKKFTEARKSLAQLLQTYPNDPQAGVAMLMLGEVQAELNDYDASATAYTTFLAKYPGDKMAYQAHFGIGWVLENRKKFDEARQAYQKVIAADNGETAARAQFQIGETYLAQGQFDKAIVALLAVDDVYAYPTWSARALLEAGRAFEQLKQPDKARDQYAQILKKYKDTPEAQLAQERLNAIAKKG